MPPEARRRRVPNVTDALQLAAMLIYPGVLCGGVAYFARAELRRPRLHLLVSIVVLYALYALTFALIGDAIPSVIAVLHGDATPAKASGFTGLVLLKLCAKPLLGFSLMALPILAANYTWFRRPP